MHWRLFLTLICIGIVVGFYIGAGHNPCYRQIEEMQKDWDEGVDSDLVMGTMDAMEGREHRPI